MARAKNQGNGRLEEAMAMFIQNQTSQLQLQTSFLARLAEIERENGERFARIESILLDHSRILVEHSRLFADYNRILQALPEAVRDKIGFKAPNPT
jgi:hypothetical protein